MLNQWLQNCIPLYNQSTDFVIWITSVWISRKHQLQLIVHSMIGVALWQYLWQWITTVRMCLRFMHVCACVCLIASKTSTLYTRRRPSIAVYDSVLLVQYIVLRGYEHLNEWHTSLVSVTDGFAANVRHLLTSRCFHCAFQPAITWLWSSTNKQSLRAAFMSEKGNNVG